MAANGHANGDATPKLKYTPLGDISKAHESTQRAFLSGKTRSYEWRYNQLRQLGYMIQENEERWSAALLADHGRHSIEAQVSEIVGIKNEVKEAMSSLKKWMRPTKAKTILAYAATSPTIYHEPKGNVLVIGTWNYPIVLLLGPAIGAIAGGNSTVLKPAEQAVNIAKLTTELVPKYMDTSAVKVVNGAIDETTELLKLKWDHIFYTGSGRVGKIIAKAAAEHLTPVTLELGGKSPCVVFDDADLTTTARRIVWGKVLNAGQTCIAPDYILVQSHVQDKLITAIKAALNEFYPSQAPLIKSDQYCKIINQGMYSRLKSLLDETKGQVVLGGETDDAGNKMSFTLIKGVKEDDSTMTGEIFGPLLPIVSAPSKEDMVKFIQARDQPLALYVFTQSKKNRDFIRNNTRSGQIMFNDVVIQFIIPGLPFGGTGPSGTGNYHGHYSFREFTHERASATVPPWMDVFVAARYPPYTPGKLKLFKMFLGSTISGKSKPGGGNLSSSKGNL